MRCSFFLPTLVSRMSSPPRAFYSNANFRLIAIVVVLILYGNSFNELLREFIVCLNFMCRDPLFILSVFFCIAINSWIRHSERAQIHPKRRNSPVWWIFFHASFLVLSLHNTINTHNSVLGSVDFLALLSFVSRDPSLSRVGSVLLCVETEKKEHYKIYKKSQYEFELT